MKTRSKLSSTLLACLVLQALALVLLACGPSQPPDGASGAIGVTVIAPDEEAAAAEAVAEEAVAAQAEPAEPAEAEAAAAGGAYPGPGEAYPGVATADSSYPGFGAASIEGVLPEPPDTARDIPAPAAEFGAVGGILVRTVTDQGFLPVTPLGLYLGAVIPNHEGEAAMIAQGDESPSAELFDTGIFVFSNVPPATYGLVIDLGFSKFPLLTETGEELLVDVEAGKAIDLGQVFVEIPGQ